jgi:branched-chain amino acid transport system ATP-binding protein
MSAIPETPPILETRHVTMRFGGLVAVDDVSLAIAPATITGLIGPNGAGKTTLFAIASGFQKPSAGRIAFNGADITGLEAHERAKAGIARTFQIVQPFAGLTIHENIAVGAHLRHPARDAALEKARVIATDLGLAAMLDQPASALTIAGRKRLELARALATEPSLLLLDEVLAGLNPSEIRDMVPVIRQIRDRGVTVLMVEHVMQAVMALCETVHVLAQGRIIASGAPAAITEDKAVIEAYLGHGAAARMRQGAAGKEKETAAGNGGEVHG